MSGVDFTSSGLGIAGAANGFQSAGDTGAAAVDLVGALGSLRGFSSQLSSDLAVAGIRAEFTSGLRNALQTGAGRLTLADANQEGATLLALQTGSSLATASFSIVQSTQAGVLRLFGS